MLRPVEEVTRQSSSESREPIAPADAADSGHGVGVSQSIERLGRLNRSVLGLFVDEYIWELEVLDYIW
jgi:hypothetical protein